MDERNQFNLGTQGDRLEQELWPLLSNRFPSYEILWRRLIVPLTCRVDQRAADRPDRWIRFRPDIPEKFVQMAMAHYSVFYFLGRAVKRLSEERAAALEYPEDVVFLLNCVGENFKRFLGAMDDLGADCGCPKIDVRIAQFPKGFGPFKEISDYRDALLHHPVIGRGIAAEKTYIPKWNIDKSASPLERTKNSWIAAEQLSSEELVSTEELLERLIREVCDELEVFWRQAITMATSRPFEQKMESVTKLEDYLPLNVHEFPLLSVPSPSGSFSSLGSNTTFLVQPDRLEVQEARHEVEPGSLDKY